VKWGGVPFAKVSVWSFKEAESREGVRGGAGQINFN